MKRTHVAWLLVIAGSVLAVIGVGLFSIPLALILAGVGLAALGLLAVEVTT